MTEKKQKNDTEALPSIRTTITQPRGKHWAIAFLEKLPDDVSFNEICYMLALRRRIQDSIEQADRGNFVSHEEVKALVESWRESPPPRKTVKEHFQDLVDGLADDASWDDAAFSVFRNWSRADSYRDVSDWGPVISRREVEGRFPGVDPYGVARVRRIFTAVLRKDGDGWSGWVESLPGANSQGSSPDELRDNLQEAARLVLESAQDRTAEDVVGAELAMREEMEVVIEVAHGFLRGVDLEKKPTREPRGKSTERDAAAGVVASRATREEDKVVDSSDSFVSPDPWSEIEVPTVENSRLLLFLTTFCELEIELSRIGNLIALVLLKRKEGRRVILTQRLYRDGVCILEDPTEEELEMAREDKDLISIWNSPRSQYMSELVY